VAGAYTSLMLLITDYSVVIVCMPTCAGEVISDDVDETGYHAEREEFVNEEDHVTAVGVKGKAEVHIAIDFIMLHCFCC